MGTGSRATRCKKRGSNRTAFRRENGQNHAKSHAIVFLAPFRADRATAVSDIVKHVAADDLKH